MTLKMPRLLKFYCPYLEGEVELSEEREHHIAVHHPDLFPQQRHCLIEVLLSPDEIRRSKRFGNALLFSRWFQDLSEGKYVVVVVVSDDGIPKRHWIVTAYIARKLAKGVIEWKRS